MPAISNPINTSKVPSYFSYLPVRIHPNVDIIDKATFDTIAICAPEGSKEHKQAIYRHSNPHGNPYALCHSECNLEKLIFLVKVVEMIWIDDDVTEELPHATAQREHEILRQGLNPQFDDDTETGLTVGVKKQFLRDARKGMLALDPTGSPGVIRTLDNYLKVYDSSEEDFLTLEEYLPYRVSNAGYLVCAHLTRWAMDLCLADEDLEAIREFEWALGEVLSLTNDYFSWRKERLQKTDRMRNAVPILMRQYGLPQDIATLLLKGIIIDKEEKAKRLRVSLESQTRNTLGLKRYAEALELYAGGNCYWSATCPRYNRPQEEQSSNVWQSSSSTSNE